MTTMMGPLGVLAGVLAMLVGALHLLMYVYFRDVISEDYRKSTITTPAPSLLPVQPITHSPLTTYYWAMQLKGDTRTTTM
jgi:hypothetical protein